MSRIKVFFKYLLLVIAFFIVSQILIYLYVEASYKYIPCESISEEYIVTGMAKAKSIAGSVKCTVTNPSSEELKNKYIKVEYYSKRETLLGTDYIKVDSVKAKDKKEFDINFKYEHVYNIKIDIVDNK